MDECNRSLRSRYTYCSRNSSNINNNNVIGYFWFYEGKRPHLASLNNTQDKRRKVTVALVTTITMDIIEKRIDLFKAPYFRN